MLQPTTPKLFFSLLLLYQLVAQSAVSLTTVPFSISLQDIYNKVNFEVRESEIENNS